MALKQPVQLPCGLKLENRICKAALAEDLANKASDPDAALSSVYAHWANGGYGAILTGNVMVDSRQKGSPSDVALPNDLSGEAREKALKLWSTWASSIQAKGTPAIMQICHPGRQSPVICRSGQAKAPSAIPLNLGPGYIISLIRYLVFGTPKEMTKADIDDVVRRFGETARLAADAGFKGCEVHAAHGYLASIFLSEVTNKRTDEYGGSAVNRARFLREIVASIRAAVPKEFAVTIKLNSADNQSEQGLKDTLEQIEFVLEGGGVDFLEISGGSYENPTMMAQDAPKDGDAAPSSRTVAREAFFLDFAAEVRKRFPDLVLMVTGGFRSRLGMQNAIESKACDLVGLGRPSIVTPRLPAEILLNDEIKDSEAVAPMKPIDVPWLVKWIASQRVGSGLVTVAYQKDLKKLIKAVL